MYMLLNLMVAKVTKQCDAICSFLELLNIYCWTENGFISIS